MQESQSTHWTYFLYRWRWPLGLTSVALCIAWFVLGMGRIVAFTQTLEAGVDQPTAKPEPQMFDTRNDIWFEPDDPAKVAYDDLEEEFIPEDVIHIAFEDRESPLGVFSPNALAATQRLTNAIKQLPYVRNVRSVTSSPWIRTAGEDGEELLVGDLFVHEASEYSEPERIERMVALLGEKRVRELLGNEKLAPIAAKSQLESVGEPRLVPGILSRDGKVSGIRIQVLRPRPRGKTLPEPWTALSEDRRHAAAVLLEAKVHGELVLKIRELLAEERGYEFHMTGVPVLEEHFTQVGKADSGLLFLVLLAVFAVMLLLYRRVLVGLIPMLVSFLAILGMWGAAWLKGDLLNNLTAATPSLVIAVGVADSVHLVAGYFAARPRHTDKHELIREVLREQALPVLLTTLTTCFGFLSIMTSTIGPVKQLGYTAAWGTFLAYGLSMTLVPLLLSLVPLRKTTGQILKKEKSLALGRIPVWSRENARLIVSITAALTVLSLIGLSRLELATDLRKMFPRDDVVRHDVDWFGENLVGMGDMELLFESAAPIATSPQFLAQVDQLQKALKEQSQKPGSPLQLFERLDSAADVVKKMHQVQHAGDSDFYRVPLETDIPEALRRPSAFTDPVTGERHETPGQSATTLIAQYYLQYENGARPTENLATSISPDRTKFRATVVLKIGTSQEMLAAFDAVNGLIAQEFPELKANQKGPVDAGSAFKLRVTGVQYMVARMFHSFTSTLVQSLLLALAVVTGLILLIFRSPALAGISILLNGMPVLIPLGVLGLIGVSLDGPAIVVGAIVLGVAVDDTIHLLFAYHRARSSGSPQALEDAYSKVGGALTATTIILVVGFSAMTLGSFRPNKMIGLLGTAMVALAWLFDFFVAPVLLDWVREREGEGEGEHEAHINVHSTVAHES